jgi:hypothetical protein
VPDPTKKSNPATAMRLYCVDSLAAEYVQDIYAWAEDINDRISLISYLNDMLEKAKITGRIQGCKEIVNFISQSSASLLKLENKVPTDLGNAVAHFKDSLITRRNLCLILQNIGLTDPIMDIISSVIAFNNTMKTVIVSRNMISDRSMVGLSKALTINVSLEELDLSRNSLTDDSLENLFEGLMAHFNLRKCILNGNRITDRGATAFARAIKEGQRKFQRQFELVSVDFEDNQIGDDGCVALAQLCKLNANITELHLSVNLVTDVGLLAIAEAVKSDVCSLNIIALADNQISSVGAHTVAEAIAVSIF